MLLKISFVVSVLLEIYFSRFPDDNTNYLNYYLYFIEILLRYHI